MLMGLHRLGGLSLCEPPIPAIKASHSLNAVGLIRDCLITFYSLSSGLTSNHILPPRIEHDSKAKQRPRVKLSSANNLDAKVTTVVNNVMVLKESIKHAFSGLTSYYKKPKKDSQACLMNCDAKYSSPYNVRSYSESKK
jgi:hypothetical protein